MKKQIIKAAAMLMLMAGLTVASAAVANGQATSRLIVQVPFDFYIGEHAVAAGKYDIVAPGNKGDVLSLRNENGKDAVMILGHLAERPRSNKLIAKLVFRRYGSTYFLWQAWMQSDSEGYEVSKTKQERALERELGKIAADHADTKPLYEVVEVIATVR